MSLEEELRSSFNAQVTQPPMTRDLAERSLRIAKRKRQAQAAAIATSVLVIAVAVPFLVGRSDRRVVDKVTSSPASISLPAAATARTSVPVSAATPAATPTAAAATAASEAPPVAPRSITRQWSDVPLKIEYLVDSGRLMRPDGRSTLQGTLPRKADGYQKALSTGGYTIALTTDAASIHQVDPQGDFRELVGDTLTVAGKGLARKTNAILGLAMDSSRVAYAIKNADANQVSSTLFLVDLASGQTLQRLDSAVLSRPIGFSRGQVVLAIDDGAQRSAGVWDLEKNVVSQWAESAGDAPVDAVGAVSLVSEGDSSCVAVVDTATVNQRFSTCETGRASTEIDRFGVLSPDGKRYAGTRASSAQPGKLWPVIGDATTGASDDRLRTEFDRLQLLIEQRASISHIAWEDATHIAVVAVPVSQFDNTRPLLLRCDVVQATCEVVYDSAVSSQYQPLITLVRAVP